MAKNKFGMGGMGGMGNINSMIKQAQKMQEDMGKMQAELETKEVEATSGGGAVKVVATGKKEIKEIIISPEIVDSDDIEMLQDMVTAAVNEALRKVDELTNSEMGKITGGLNIPGLM